MPSSPAAADAAAATTTGLLIGLVLGCVLLFAVALYCFVIRKHLSASTLARTNE
jgi:Mg/Co/Ni transporter MgtE